MTTEEKAFGILGVLLAIGVVLSVFVLPALIVALPALIAWLLWNHALAPLFHGPHLSFLQTFAILWLIGFIANTLGRVLRFAPGKS